MILGAGLVKSQVHGMIPERGRDEGQMRAGVDRLWVDFRLDAGWRHQFGKKLLQAGDFYCSLGPPRVS